MQDVTPTSVSSRLQFTLDMPRAASSKSARHQAVNAFLGYCGDKLSTLENIDSRILTDWAIRMNADGYSISTIAYYIKVLSSAFTDAGAPSEVFTIVRKQVKEFEFVNTTDFDALRRVIFELSSNIETNSLSQDLLLTAVLAGGLSVDKLLSLQKDELPETIEALTLINNKYTRPRARKLFPLSSKREVALRIKSTINRYGLNSGVDGLWAIAALKLGLEPKVVKVVIGHVPEDVPLLSLADDTEISETERLGALEFVADGLTDNPFRWFAMQLRQGEDYERVAQQSGLSPENIYYPSREIARRVGRKMVVTTKPFLPGIVFFRSRITDVAPIFHRIGSMAWVYRQTPSPLSPYAIITPHEMRAFQLAVGVLTAESKLPTEMRPGDTVEIIGGDFRGLTAQIQSVAPNVYRLLLPALNGIPWQIDADPRLLCPTPNV